MKFIAKIDNGQGGRTVLEAEDMEEAIEEAEEWTLEGTWPVRDTVTVRVTSEDGDEDRVEVEVGPSDDELLIAAGADPDCDHEWVDDGCLGLSGAAVLTTEFCAIAG